MARSVGRPGHFPANINRFSRKINHSFRTGDMKCPFCQSESDRVLDTRSLQNGFAIRRRRECHICHQRYTTYERVERITVRIVKKDGVREPFDHAKIRRGLERACWKRPVGEAQIDDIVAAIETEIEALLVAEVESRYIGELVMQYLREVDEVAYIRFASVYRRFEDAHDFADELRPLLNATARTLP